MKGMFSDDSVIYRARDEIAGAIRHLPTHDAIKLLEDMLDDVKRAADAYNQSLS